MQRTTRTCSLVQTVLLGAYLLAAVAARVPSLKLHIPFISTLRISFRFGCGCPTQSKVPSRQSQNFVIESRLVRRGNLVETKLQTFSTPVPQLFIVNYSLFIKKKRSPDGERFFVFIGLLCRNFCFFLLCEEYAETNADADDYDARNDCCKKNRREIVLLCGESRCADFVNLTG